MCHPQLYVKLAGRHQSKFHLHHLHCYYMQPKINLTTQSLHIFPPIERLDCQFQLNLLENLWLHIICYVNLSC